MATEADVHRIASALPGAIGAPPPSRLAWSVMANGKEKGFAWSWLERLHPKQARVENRAVLAVRVANAEEKALLLAQDESKIFTEPHYNGFPAVLVRLANVTVAELERLVVEAWRCMAPKNVVGAYDGGGPPPTKKAVAKTAAATKPTAKKSAVAKTAVAKTAAVKKPRAKKSAVTKPTAKTSAVKKPTARKATVARTAVKKRPAAKK